MSNNAAKFRARHRRLAPQLDFCGSDSGGRRAAAIYMLIETRKLNDVDPRAWLTDVLPRIADHLMKRITNPLPWTSKVPPQLEAAYLRS